MSSKTLYSVEKHFFLKFHGRSGDETKKDFGLPVNVITSNLVSDVTMQPMKDLAKVFSSVNAWG